MYSTVRNVDHHTQISFIYVEKWPTREYIGQRRTFPKNSYAHTWFLLVTAASKRSLCGRGKVCFSSVGELLQNNEHNHNIAHQTLASLLIHT